MVVVAVLVAFGAASVMSISPQSHQMAIER